MRIRSTTVAVDKQFTQPECEFVALGVLHKMRMLRIAF
jgi:hypothetical protein